MSPNGSRPCQADEFDDVEHVGWTAANALLNAQQTGTRALEDYLLMMNYHRTDALETADLDALIADAIEAHYQIIEDLECARDAVDALGAARAETP
jgi:hypothetical protein